MEDQGAAEDERGRSSMKDPQLLRYRTGEELSFLVYLNNLGEGRRGGTVFRDLERAGRGKRQGTLRRHSEAGGGKEAEDDDANKSENEEDKEDKEIKEDKPHKTSGDNGWGEEQFKGTPVDIDPGKTGGSANVKEEGKEQKE